MWASFKSWRNARRIRLTLQKKAGSYESARNVYERKSIWMVEYLRQRRTANDLIQPKYIRTSAKGLRAFARRKHCEEKDGSNPEIFVEEV